MDTNDTSPLRAAIAYGGGQLAVAKELGVSPQAVSRWVKRDRAPSDRCIALENVSKGKVTRYALRPDVFGTAPPKRRRS